MPFQSENEFEACIRELITRKILPLDKSLIMLQNKKAVDILICKNDDAPALYFIEIKYHKKAHGRLGTGHGKGGGIQPEILKLQPDYFKNGMRWILGTEDKEGYWFVDNIELAKFLSGREIGEKYNNIQARLFREIVPLNKSQFIHELKQWLL